MRVAICDDNFSVGQQVGALVNEIVGEECSNVYVKVESLLSDLKQKYRPDVVIMDIEWEGEGKGLHFAEMLSELYPGLHIVYLTGYTQKYVQQIFFHPSNISGFLMKPVDKDILREILKKIEKEDRSKEKNFVVKLKGKLLTFRYDEILYLESAGHRVDIITTKKQSYCYGKLQEFTKTFPDNFVHCHKSYLVNLKHVRNIELGRHSFVMDNGTEIPISKARYAGTRDYYFHYLKTTALGKKI